MGIHISLGILVWGYTKHGDTHITVTPVTDYPRAFDSFPRIAGSGNEIVISISYVNPTAHANLVPQARKNVNICHKIMTISD